MNIQMPPACPMISVLSCSKRADKRILVFSVEDEWADLDSMQSSMQTPRFHLHNILATWDT